VFRHEKLEMLMLIHEEKKRQSIFINRQRLSSKCLKDEGICGEFDSKYKSWLAVSNETCIMA